MSSAGQISAAVESARFGTNEREIMAEALRQSEPWTGAELLRRMPERDRSCFYRALARLLKREILTREGRRYTINANLDQWKARQGDGKLFAGNTPEALGLLRRTSDGVRPTKRRRNPKKIARVKPASVEEPRPGIDDNGDQPNQRHLTDPSGADFNEKELDPWEKLQKRLRAAHRKP